MSLKILYIMTSLI